MSKARPLLVALLEAAPLTPPVAQAALVTVSAASIASAAFNVKPHVFGLTPLRQRGAIWEIAAIAVVITVGLLQATAAVLAVW